MPGDQAQTDDRTTAADYARAHAEALELLRGRPDMSELVVRSMVPRWVATRYLWSMEASGAVMLLAGVLSWLANPGPWFLHAVDLLLLVLGGATLVRVWHEIRHRRAEAMRLREHGPDECDTLVDSGVAFHARPWWRRLLGLLFDLAVVALPVVVAVRAWAVGDAGQKLFAVLAVGCVLLGSALMVHAARTGWQWRRAFLWEFDLDLPPVRDEWQVLLR
ncbi:MAG: hypothetical protein HOY78_25870 [Saccharothrix sp.]|nr:hypothetical protein [Saccharothrix sp.]